jgi:hypothetical protein
MALAGTVLRVRMPTVDRLHIKMIRLHSQIDGANTFSIKFGRHLEKDTPQRSSYFIERPNPEYETLQ